MRTVTALFAFCWVVAFSQAAAGEPACAPDPRKLGVSRTVLVDTTPGSRHGAQHGGAGFLADGEVVLTFDDGPARAYTKPILDALAAHCAKATFFMVGRMAIADPDMVKQVAQRGHTVAAHTWSHGNLQLLAPEDARAEIEMGISAVQKALGRPIAAFFRFPYLRHTPYSAAYVHGRGLAAFAIDIDSRDYHAKDPAAVRERVLSELAAKRKGIVLFHDIHAWTASALPGLLDEMKIRGYRIVHLEPKTRIAALAEYDARVREEGRHNRVAAAGRPPAKDGQAWPWTLTFAPAAGAEPAKAPSAGPSEPRRRPAAEDWMAELWRQ
jgi:peptidoglycan/xylan/chitin deacetylase (PgdA/CDA1 family)